MPVPENLVETPQEAQSPQMDHESSQQSINLEGLSQITMLSEKPTEQAESQVYKYRHGDGNEFSGTLFEARKICPVIGKMSIENAQATLRDADLASRVAQRGRERREAETAKIAEAKQNAASQTAVLDPKLEKSQTQPAVYAAEALADKIVGPKIDEITKFAASDPAVPDLPTLLLPHAGEARTAGRDAVKFEEVFNVRIEKSQPAKKQQSVPSIGNGQAVTEVKVVETLPYAENRAPVSNEYTSLKRDGRPSASSLSSPSSIEGNAAESSAIPTKAESRRADETTTQTEVVDALDDKTSEDMPELAIPEVFGTSYLNKISPDIFEPRLLAPENVAETAETGIRPLVAIPELPAPIVEIEHTMDQLLEVVEKDEDEASGTAVAILKTIISLPARAEIDDDNIAGTLEEKLEELFVELFEEAEIPYTPELVKSFVKLTKTHHLEELLEVVKESDEEDRDLPDEIGTREFLQKLQRGLGAMKQNVIDFYELGKSILRLYSSNMEAATQTVI